MPHGKPITINRVEYAEPTPVKRKDVPPGQVFSHRATNVDDGGLYVALDGSSNPYIPIAALERDQYMLAMRITTGSIVYTDRASLVYLRDADLSVGGAK